MLQNWLKIYWAHLIKNKVYSVLTILGLAIGIWGVLLSYLYYKEEVRYDQWNPYKDEVYIVSTDLGDGDVWNLAPYPMGAHLKEEKQSIEDYMYLSNYVSHFLEFEGEQHFFTKGLVVQSNFFDFFPFELVEGVNALDEPNSVLVLDTYIEEIFGSNALGKTFRYDGEVFTIKGIYSFGETRSSIMPTILFSGFEKSVLANQMNWGNYMASLYLKIKDKEQIPRVEQSMTDLLFVHLYTRLAKEEGKTVEEYLEEEGDTVELYRLLPLAGQHMMEDTKYNGTLETPLNVKRLYILFGLSLTILILSVVNYINLSIVQSLKRHREMGIRIVIGSKYTTLFWQLFFESCLTLGLAMGLSCVLVEFSIPSLRVFLSSQLNFNWWDGAKVGGLFMVIMSAFLAGILLVILQRRTISQLVKGQGRHGNQKFGLKHIMLIIQFAIASFFIVSTTIVYQQVHYMLEKDLGFTKEQILILPFSTIKTEKERKLLYDTYKAEILKVSGVQSVSSSSLAIGGYGYNSSRIFHQGNAVQVTNVAMDNDFLQTMQIKIVEGRGLEKELASDTISNVLINQQLKDKFGDPDILNKTLNWNDRWFTVIGVVNNYHTVNLKTDFEPMIFFRLEVIPGLFQNVNELYVRFTTPNGEQIIDEVEKIYTKLGVSTYPFTYEFLDQRFERLFKSSIQERNILLVLSGIVIFIALFGLYSVASFTIANQYKEIAIRKVLGASNKEQMKQLSQRYIVLGVIGFALSIYPSYYFMNAWLNEYVFRIEIHWSNFVLAFLFLMLLTFLTVFIKVRQAVRVNVLQHIKYE
ncbi:ABC transporter permease [Myroides odoratus]|uniref:ABC transporter permease n=1 Tax=Myroides odoratus TaxID=256 RepID=A0A9Q6Z2X1_MYROD|nr:ABC transporter permease [Myroides odoratus]EHQ42302.1 protein of unknown function DUF214 [Myroides odoratus DSM 2801]EKB09408.1 hypothetical protein HMPREF9716_00024 [Myroides odoratus CIP 103059]QQT99677.1 ABC transporter permease [Myroides odoratus]WQD58114.1 FtsX-like permease family protein [Myroides odoratus]STZ29562.1 Macrolide export ATP-binding/permease protein MacB [Myroides odoratus]